tara:strand:- start:694 stop:1080 length:387 start_codon:yes stop_codon:yes gene_type:complete
MTSLFDATQAIRIANPKMELFAAAEQAYAELAGNSDAVMPLAIDGCDAAVVGTVVDSRGQILIVYDYEQLVGVFVEQFKELDDSTEAAVEWVSFNIIGAHMGAGTPLIMYPGDREMADCAIDNYAEME